MSNYYYRSLGKVESSRHRQATVHNATDEEVEHSVPKIGPWPKTQTTHVIIKDLGSGNGGHVPAMKCGRPAIAGLALGSDPTTLHIQRLVVATGSRDRSSEWMRTSSITPKTDQNPKI